MNRADLQALSQLRLEEAQELLGSGHFEGAYHLAGYAIECAIKACIARKTQQFDFPDKDLANRAWGHEFAKLIESADLKSELLRRLQVPAFQVNWAIASMWRAESRYRRPSEREARDLIRAMVDPSDGVLEWLKAYW